MQRSRIIVGVDLDGDLGTITPGSRAAALEALRLAELRAATVEFLHSTYYDREYPQHDDLGGWTSRPLWGAGREALVQLVRECEAAGVASELILVEPPPVVALCRAAKRPGTELLVLGRHNHIENGSRLGSVSEGLLQVHPTLLWIVTPRAPVRV